MYRQRHTTEFFLTEKMPCLYSHTRIYDRVRVYIYICNLIIFATIKQTHEVGRFYFDFNYWVFWMFHFIRLVFTFIA